jgi:hypothetical protein
MNFSQTASRFEKIHTGTHAYTAKTVPTVTNSGRNSAFRYRLFQNAKFRKKPRLNTVFSEGPKSLWGKDLG